jgi:ornithine carbamoyltransferase
VKGKHLLGLNDFRRDEIETILGRSAVIKAEWKAGRGRQSLAGKSVALIFEKSSTRTRVSFDVGITQLGGHPVFLTGNELQLKRGEPIKDTARVLSRYVDAIVIRANRHEDVVEFARYSSVPVVNALTDLLHPCQILGDLLTIREAGYDLDRFKIAFIGDGNNVANSWINAAALFPFDLRLACPAGYDPDPGLRKRAEKMGARLRVLRRPEEAAEGADVLYTDVWVSMGQEQETAERKRAFAGFQIDSRLLGLAAPGCKVMHCLPAHRGEEISEEALEGERSLVFPQAENRLHIQKGIMELLLTGE